MIFSSAHSEKIRAATELRFSALKIGIAYGALFLLLISKFLISN